MKVALAVMVVAGAFAATAVQAQDVLKDKGCVKCHDVDKKKVGPSMKDIAAKHKDGKDQAALVAKIKDGKGHPKVAGTDDELNAAVKAVLSTK